MLCRKCRRAVEADEVVYDFVRSDIALHVAGAGDIHRLTNDGDPLMIIGIDAPNGGASMEDPWSMLFDLEADSAPPSESKSSDGSTRTSFDLSSSGISITDFTAAISGFKPEVSVDGDWIVYTPTTLGDVGAARVRLTAEPGEFTTAAKQRPDGGFR